MPVDKWENIGLSIQDSVNRFERFQESVLHELRTLNDTTTTIGVKASMGLIVAGVSLTLVTAVILL